MINLNFGLWWSGAPLSYLRYLTFKSLRHFHPHSRIQLYMSPKFKVGNMDMVTTDNPQEFVRPDSVKEDYLPKVDELDVEIVHSNAFQKFAPNHQSDLFRWYFLKEHGGFYLDTDQIIVRSFKSLPLKKEFIYSSYDVDSPYALDNHYTPVGVMGATRGSKVIKDIANRIFEYYDESNYNSIGPWMLNERLNDLDLGSSFNAPSSYFYPAPICNFTDGIYDGSLEINEDAYSIHWFGGYGSSQVFNQSYTEEFAKKSDDSISRFLRKARII